jgi:hypothetical protein
MVPQANRLIVGIMAMVADEERHMMPALRPPLRRPRDAGRSSAAVRGAKITPSIRRAAKAAVKARTDARAVDLAPVITELKIGRHYELERTGARAHGARHRDSARRIEVERSSSVACAESPRSSALKVGVLAVLSAQAS